jgi:protein TonB
LEISQEASSTAVTLVSPEQSTPAATQAVNSEASPAPAKEAEPKKIQPEPEKAQPEPEMPQEETPPPKEVPKPSPVPKPTPPKEEPPREPSKAETPLPPVEKVEAIKSPAKTEVALPPPKPLEAPTHFDPQKLLALKVPLPEPVTKRQEKKPRCSKQKKHRVYKKAHKMARSASHQKSGRNSVHSRARRGGSAHVNRLLAAIKRRIARNKSYPAAARRRRMQGQVRVSFTVTRSGNVRDIHVRGPRIFAASARTAVCRAFPISVKGAAQGLPRLMSVTLSYRLR